MELLNYNIEKPKKEFTPFKLELRVDSLQEAAILQILFNAGGLGFNASKIFAHIDDQCQAQGLNYKYEDVWKKHSTLVHNNIRVNK